MTPQAYRVGAVVYHEKVRQIWDAFGDWFSERGLALQVRFFDAYADQVRALVRGDLDTAWNTNLAYAPTLQLTDGAIWWARGIEARGLSLEALATAPQTS